MEGPKGKAASAKKGDWVRIHSILLWPDERAENLPEDTARVPLEMWNKGFLLGDGKKVGETVIVETVTGRKISGTLIEIFPSYRHGFGEYIPEISTIDRQLTSLMEEIRHEQ